MSRARAMPPPRTPVGEAAGILSTSRDRRRSGDASSRRHSVPYEQHDNRAQRCRDEAGPLVGAVPPDGLSDKGRDECAGDAERRRQQETGRLVGARCQQAGNDSRAKPMTMIQRRPMVSLLG